jgi:orotidine-5'-phosphate decarboxylase
VAGIRKIREILPNTKLAMVSVLTDISEVECLTRFGMPPALKILTDFLGIKGIYQTPVNQSLPETKEPFEYVVCSPKELLFLKKNLPDCSFIVPGIRDEWMKNSDEHQKRTTGVREALRAGANLLVMGAQLTKGNPAADISAKESRDLTKKEISLFYE